MSEMLVLTKGSTNYVLSEVSRTYQRSQEVTGSASRSITGKLNYRTRAIKTIHNVTWDKLTYDEAPDNGIGLETLEALVRAGGEYTLTVSRYGVGWETFTVVLDPASFTAELAKVRGMGRRLWRVSLTMLEV